jgi:CRP-like cAMP-binding protein
MATKIPSFRLNHGFTSIDGAGGKAIRNNILHSLPRQELKNVFAKLELVDLPHQMVLHEPGKPIKFAYFINSGLASVLNVLSDGKSVEVGLTGREGFVGIPLIVGFRSSPSLTIMQVAGTGFRIHAEDFSKTLNACPQLRKILNRYSQELMMQSMQIAACNRIHEVEERLARWLLMSQDRLESDNVPLTQQSLANMLGTRRASVTVAAGILQKAGLITYNRGKVKIEKRRRLETASCECYQKLNEQFQRWRKESK